VPRFPATEQFVEASADTEIIGADTYDLIVALAEALGRPVKTLLALAPNNDPFFAGRGARREGAEWFAELWNRFGFGPGTHIRRVHYILVSQGEPIIWIDGTAYQNTDNCWYNLKTSSRDARYLRLVPIEHFDDRRNDGVHEYLFSSAQAATLTVEEANHLSTDLSALWWLSSGLCEPSDYVFEPPVVDQRYHIELWAEKTTMNDVLLDLGQLYGLNVVAATGEISLTHCHRLVERAKTIGRPVRILYNTDFDPGGMSMPVAAARKIEFLIRRDALDLDIQLRPIVLTHEQCVHYRLPRTPIKESESRGEKFEERFGKGATELDALEALHPGELRRLLVNEINRYHDYDLDDRVAEAAEGVRGELGEIRDGILYRHKATLAALRKDLGELVRKINAELKRIAGRYAKAFKKITERHNELQTKITEELEDEAPDVDGGMEWPEPDEGDEDDDPLFDSTRDYVEQADRYKQHQGQPTERKTRKNGGEP
jgi:hypothetical protein